LRTKAIIHLPEGEHLSPDYLAINPDGRPRHDGHVITETSVINEYLDDAFPIRHGRRARSSGPHAALSQIVDEHLFHAIATIGWAFGIGPILRERGLAEFEKSLARITLHSSDRNGSRLSRLSEQDIDVEKTRTRSSGWSALVDHPHLAGPTARSPISTCCPRPSGCRAGRPIS
jgi:glutathione S-transferase